MDRIAVLNLRTFAEGGMRSGNPIGELERRSTACVWIVPFGFPNIKGLEVKVWRVHHLLLSVSIRRPFLNLQTQYLVKEMKLKNNIFIWSAIL